MAKRDGLLKMLEDCDKGKIDYIIVKSISRFSRNTVESIETVRKLCADGIYIYFEKENIDTGKMESELLLSILSSLAESESHSIAENNRWSIQKRFQNGTYKISYPPYGYDNVDGEMVINQEQAEVVRWIFEEVLAGGSVREIAKFLNERGVQSKRKGTWTGGTILGMIKNEKYCGDALFQKTYTDDRFNRYKNYGERTQYLMQDHHEAIVTREMQEAAIALIAVNASEKGIAAGATKYQNRYAFSGKIICGECGATWKRIVRAKYAGYACNTHIDNKDACSMMVIKEEPIKAAFATMMNKLTAARNQILVPYSDMLRTLKDADTYGRLNEIEELLEKNQTRKQQITQFFSKSLLDPAVFAAESDSLDEEAARMEVERKLLTQQLNGGHDQKKALEKLLKYTAKGRALMKFDDGLFTEHVDHIIVFSRTEIGFAMKCGPVFRERID